jgi:hypothetical protein
VDEQEKKIACGTLKSEHHLPKDRFRPRAWSVDKPVKPIPVVVKKKGHVPDHNISNRPSETP